MVQYADIPERKNPSYSRGLWQATYFDGVVTAVNYFETDVNDLPLDPFCGPADVENPIFNDRIMDNSTLQVWNRFVGTRSANVHNWCRVRKTSAILVAISLFCSWLAAIFSHCAFAKNTKCAKWRSIVFHTFAAAFGLAATIIFGLWLFKEQHDVVVRDNPFEGHVNGGFSFVMLIIGWVLQAVAASLVLFDVCSNRQNVVPLTTSSDIPPAYSPSDEKASLLYRGRAAGEEEEMHSVA